MSSAVVSTSAASRRLFIFGEEEVDSEPVTKLRPQSVPYHVLGNAVPPPALKGSADSRLANIIPASRLDVRPAPQMVATGIPAVDALTGGLPRGCLTEICGPASSGRTTFLHSAVAAATSRGEFCVVIDATDALDPQSVAAAGVRLDKLLWVRCGENSSPKQKTPGKILPQNRVKEPGRIEFQERLAQVLRATDLLLDSGGFGLIVLDLADLPPQAARYIPLTTWFRFRRTVEHTPTVLLVIEQQPIAGSCSSLLLRLGPAEAPAWEKREQADRDAEKISHSQLLTGMEITTEVLRARPQRKPARAVSVSFFSKTAWAG